MKKRIAILGSTGSIGTQALDVIRKNPDHFEVEVLTAHNNVSLLVRQAKQFQPNIEDTQIKLVTNEVMKKLINQKETLAFLPENELNKIISDEASLLINNL